MVEAGEREVEKEEGKKRKADKDVSYGGVTAGACGGVLHGADTPLGEGWGLTPSRGERPGGKGGVSSLLRRHKRAAVSPPRTRSVL